ncbi:phospho-2-dehydro-3-deoxyheptonate aldolase, partial [mine drainage metagenome]
MLRGGAFKPRTSPDSFQGLGTNGLELLKQAKEETGLAIVTELLDPGDLDDLLTVTDIIQIGSRNSQNFPMLRKVGRTGKPVLFKRGFGNTIDEFLNAAKYITREGNNKVILAERGIRTFEPSTRFTLEISAVPVIQERVDLPVIVDPSHPAGIARYVAPLSRAAVAVGSDGLMIEVHPDPPRAKSDSQQQLDFNQ